MTAALAPTVLPVIAAPACPLRLGQRVEVTTGGRRGERGHVADIYPRNGQTVVVTLLDTLTHYYGPVKAVTE